MYGLAYPIQRSPGSAALATSRYDISNRLEIGLGDETTIAAFNVEFAYQFRSPEAWNVYAGAGPALNIIDRERETDAEAGFNVLVGVAHEDGLFAELKVGAFDSPRLKFGVGYAFRWR